MVSRSFFMVFVLLQCQCNEERTQHDENEGLEESHQELKKTHEYGERNCHSCTTQATAQAFAGISEHAYQSNKSQDDDVSVCDVGKKSDHQCERLDEYTEYLNRHKDDLHTERHTRRP